MENKLFIILAYVMLGVSIAAWPILITKKNEPYNSHSYLSVNYFNNFNFPKIFSCIIFTIGIAIFIFKLNWNHLNNTLLLILSFTVVAIATSFQNARFHAATALGIFFVLCVTTTLPWWQWKNNQLDISNNKIILFSAIIFILIYKLSKPKINENKSPAIWIIFFALIAGIQSFSTGIFDENNSGIMWHHWGAYIGPAELMLSGASIFHDFPAQYGFGPTALIASACMADCWRGMYYIVGFTTFAYTCLIATLALSLSHNNKYERFIIFITLIIVCFFWNNYPPGISSLLTYPSVTGMRFFPAIFLVSFLFFNIAIEKQKSKIFIAHLLWILGVLWSPESAFYVTFVWWPYYIIIHQKQAQFTARVINAVYSIFKLILITVLLISSLWFIYYIIYNKNPTINGVFAYVLSPPGAMQLNIYGAFLFYTLSILMGLFVLIKLRLKFGDTEHFRKGFLLHLLSYSVFSYFLGRSHDNNILNLLPFILLVLIHTHSTKTNDIFLKLNTVLIAALVGWIPFFGWAAYAENITQGKIFNFAPKFLGSKLVISNLNATIETDTKLALPDKFTGITAEASKIISFLVEKYNEPITLLDTTYDLVRSDPSNVWNAIHGPVNFAYIPSTLRQEFLKNTAKSLQRNGWLVVDRNISAQQWLIDFDSAYDRTDQLNFENYYAIHFSIK